MGFSDRTTLEHVRLRGARVDAPVARLRLSYLLSSASLQPPAMPPSAILLVRSMADPLPGRISSGFTPGSLASAEWERAAQDRLAASYGSAARPMWGPAPSTAAAVLFADYGEMLACLARDLASGTALGWWWESTLRRFPARLPGSWAAAWVEQPLYVPAALEYLERQQQAVKVLERIAPVQAWNLLRAVLSAFALGGLLLTRGPSAGWAFEPTPPATGTEPRAALAAANLAIETEEDLDPHIRAPAIASFPWEPHVARASTPPELGYERQALLGVGLLLRRVPQVAFSTAFALRFRAWVRQEEAGVRARAADSPPPDLLSSPARSRALRSESPLAPRHSLLAEKGAIPVAKASPTHAQPGRAEDRERATPDEGPASSLRSSTLAEHVLPSQAAHPSPRTLSIPVESRERAILDDGSAPSAHPSTLAEGSLLAPTKPNQPAGQRRDSAVSKATRRSADQLQVGKVPAADALVETVPSTPAREWEGGEPTWAGGILYLIHFLRQAELLRQFDTGLGGWALLELLGRCLLDDTPNLADDAIWAALAHLDSRDPRTPPGLAFKPQHTYAAPLSWLANAAEQPRLVRFRSRGLEIWSAEGFLVLDSEDGVPPSGALRPLTSSRRRKLRRPARVRPIGLSLSPELRRFLHFVLPYARWRLDRALRGARLEEALLRTGRLYLTATHVDLVMPMKEISVPVRLAGLDANPGWMRELGRVVTFHFVQEGY